MEHVVDCSDARVQDKARKAEALKAPSIIAEQTEISRTTSRSHPQLAGGTALYLVSATRARQHLMHGLQLRVGQQRAEVGAAEALAGARHLLQAYARAQRQPGRQRPQNLRPRSLSSKQQVDPYQDQHLNTTKATPWISLHRLKACDDIN